METVTDLIEKCRRHCPSGVRPSAEETMALIAEIERLRKALKEIAKNTHDIEASACAWSVLMNMKPSGPGAPSDDA